MVTPLPKDRKTFTEGWESRLRSMARPLPNDGNLFYRRIGTAFAVGRELLFPMDADLFFRGMCPAFQGMGNPSRKMGAPFPRTRETFAAGWEPHGRL